VSTPKTRLARLKTIEDVRRRARAALPRGLFEFIDRGTEQELALAHTRRILDELRFRPRVLVDVSGRSTVCEFMGRSHAMPLAIAPTGAGGLTWHRGEVELARAAAHAGVPIVMATRAMSSFEDVAAVPGGHPWVQLYAAADEAAWAPYIDRAWQAGFGTLVVTVDTPTVPRRDYNDVNGFSIPFRLTPRSALDLALHPRWCWRVLGRSLMGGSLPRIENMPGRPTILKGAPAASMLDGRLSWDVARAMRARWPGLFVLKGILHPEDAERAVDLGAQAIVVSSHGGRNLDGALSPMEALPEIAERVGHRTCVFVDGGIKRGSDIAKALALGAHAVMVGRATLFGAAVAGQAGVEHVLGLLQRELLYTMAMLGCPDLASLGPWHLHNPPEASLRAAERRSHERPPTGTAS
jgi:(S)-mandelate dehydrogenase